MKNGVSDEKVFCLGFQKSGTTSLGRALEALGYRVQGYYHFRDLAKKKDLTWEDIWLRATELFDECDAFKDTPWFALYERLDREFPDAKFILVKRSSDEWIKSAVGDFKSYPNEIHRLIYGSAFPLGNEKAWVDRYNQHNNEVEAYFDGQAHRFLSINLNHDEFNWKVLCPFLKKPIPDIPWPHSNTRRSKSVKMFWSRMRSRLGRIIGIMSS